MMAPVSRRLISVARSHGLLNVTSAAIACREAGIPFSAACALLQKESGGRNVYGHDENGALSGYPHPVTRDNYLVFEWLVFDQGMRSNGVGPCQITWDGFFPDMRSKGLKPWDTLDNMVYGFGLLALYRAERRVSWEDAGTRYNGSRAYGEDFAEVLRVWRQRFRDVEGEA